MIKVYRYEIDHPLDMDWKMFKGIMYQLQHETRFVMNKTIQMAWEWLGYSSDYKKENGEYPKLKEVLQENTIRHPYSRIHGYAYDVLKSQVQLMNKSNFSQSIKRASDRFKAMQKEIVKGEASIPSYKANLPIDIIKNNMELNRMKHGVYFASLSLLSNEAKKELGIAGKISVVLNVGGAGRVILDRIVSGDYGLSASQLILSSDQRGKKNKWYLNLSYEFQPQATALDPHKIMGIDLGDVVAVYMAFHHSLARYRIDGGEIKTFRKQIEARRISMLRQGKYSGSMRGGHGRKKRIEPIEKLRGKIVNFRNTINHRYSRYIVDAAVKECCGVIHMEDLSDIRDIGSKFLQTWPYYDLQQKILYKCEEMGIQVVKINPRYTSQRCSECGHIDSRNRTDQAKFKCKKCGYEANADYNAARNIAIPNIDKIIAESL